MDIGVIFFFFQAEDGIRDKLVTGVQTCALPIFRVQPLRRLAARRARPTPAHAIACGPRRAYGPPRLSGAAPRLAPPTARRRPRGPRCNAPMLDTLRRFGYKSMGLASLSKPQGSR